MDGSNLTASGQKELQSYLNFFNLKKQEISSEIEMDFRDFFDHQVTETLYNQDDLQGLLSNLRKIIQTSVDKQVAKMVHMGGVYVKIFLSVANDLDFHADFSFIENIQIIEQMKILEKGGSIVENSSANQKPVKYQRLATLDTGIQSKIPIIEEQLDETTKELEFLRQYNQKLQNELILLKKDVVTDTDQVKQLQAQIEFLTKENENLKLEMDKKLHDSVQFKNLKQMIQEKNQLIKELQQKS